MSRRPPCSKASSRSMPRAISSPNPTRRRPTSPGCSPPATSRTRSSARRSPPPAWAAWPPWRRNASWPRTRFTANRKRPNRRQHGKRGHRFGGQRLGAAAADVGRAVMDWDKLRIFHAVAEAGSFTHDGEALNLNQSAVSRQIGALKESINVTLVHRHAHGQHGRRQWRERWCTEVRDSAAGGTKKKK